MGKSGDIIDSPLTAEGVEMYSFNGRFNNRLDDKNRIRIPAKFKADLGANYKFAFGPGESIYVMPEKEYQKILSASDCTIVDGDCGLLSPIAPSTQTVDLVKKLLVPLLFVVTPREDSINDLSIFFMLI